MLLKKTMLSLALLLSVFYGFSQTFAEDIRRCQSTYLQATSFKTTINVKVVSVENETVFAESYSIARKKNKYLYMVNDLIVLLGDHYSVMVAKNKKAIMVKKRESDDQVMGDGLEVPNMDSIFNLLSIQSRISDLGSTNNVKKYGIVFSNAYYASATIHIDQTRHTLDKVVYAYNKSIAGFDGYATIEFKNVSVNGEMPNETFDEQKFIVVGQSGITPAAGFKGYEVFEVDSFNK